MKKVLPIVLITTFVVLLFIPFDTVVVPEWRVRLVDEHGTPYPGKLVRQFCDNYTLGVSPCQNAPDAMQDTDSNGYVVFPKRVISMSVGARIIRTLSNVLLAFAHGSLGTSTYLDSSGPQGYKTLRYDAAALPPEHFVLPSNGESPGSE